MQFSSNHMRSAAFSEPMCVTGVCLQAFAARDLAGLRCVPRAQHWLLFPCQVYSGRGLWVAGAPPACFLHRVFSGWAGHVSV